MTQQRTNRSRNETGVQKHWLRTGGNRLKQDSQRSKTEAETADLLKSSVSVIIPSWNSMSAGKSIDRAIRSVLSQGLQKVEVLVVDNLSTDRTTEVCAQRGVALYS